MSRKIGKTIDADAQAKIDEAKRTYMRKWMAARYQQRKAAGICVVCGKPSRPGLAKCEECAKKENAWHKADYVDPSVPRAWPTGWCCICCEPTDPDRKLCEKHRKSSDVIRSILNDD